MGQSEEEKALELIRKMAEAASLKATANAPAMHRERFPEPPRGYVKEKKQ